MEEHRNYATAGDSTCSRKRPRRVDEEEPSADTAGSKLARRAVEFVHDFPPGHERDVESDSSESEETRAESRGVRSSPEAKRIEEDLLNILDDADEPAIQGLESVIRSFEEEILLPSSFPPVEISDEVTSSEPVPGRLLEASGDELGAGKEEKGIGSVDSAAMDGHHRGGVGNEDEIIIPFDSFGFESDGNDCCDAGVDFAALAELFHESEETCDPAEISELLQWQPESLSAS